MPAEMDERQRLILLNMIPEIGSLRTTRLLEAFGTLEAVFRAAEQELRRVEGIGPVRAQRLLEWVKYPERAAHELTLAQQAACSVITQVDSHYPKPLRKIFDPPLALYIRGSLVPQDLAAIAIVGSRNASIYGQETAERLAFQLAERGFTVVSGLARGIDAAAHRGALRAHGRTLAVMGHGLSLLYPPEHERLAGEIAQQGALISEYPMTMPPLGENFPRRNRIISGLSLGVVVVEASARSGALLTVGSALEQSREVFAVPGKIDSLTSQGTNQLLQQGAKLVTCVDDILEEFAGRTISESERVMVGRAIQVEANSNFTRPDKDVAPGKFVEPRRMASQARVSLQLSAEEQKILDSLSAEEPCELDAVVEKTGLAASTCAAVLLGLELKRQVAQLPGKRFLVRA